MRSHQHRHLHHGSVVQVHGQQITVLQAWYCRNKTVVLGFRPDGTKCRVRVR